MARILILDDEEDLVEICGIILQEAGYVVDAETSPVRALARASRVRPDLVLLDWVMPDLSGDEVLLRLRQGGTADVPVLMMSASPNAATFSRAIGADAFLAKPFDPDTLLDAVAQVLAASNRRADPPVR